GCSPAGWCSPATSPSPWRASTWCACRCGPSSPRSTRPRCTSTTGSRPEMTGPPDDHRADRSRGLPHRIETDAESVQRDLVRLVLTIVELLRQLMERQALRRVDQGTLDDDQVEDLGLALMK